LIFFLLSFVISSAISSRSWLLAPIFLVAVALLLRSLLLLRLLFVAPPAAALWLLQRLWLLQWVLFLATLRALLLAASAVLFFCYSIGRSFGCVN
jgi:hypothetical protein